MKTMNLSEALAKLEKDPIREFHVENNKDIRLKADKWGSLVIHDRMGYTVEPKSFYLFEKWVEVEKELSLHTVLKLSIEDEDKEFKLVLVNSEVNKITSTFRGILGELLRIFSGKEIAKALGDGKWYLAD